MCKGLALSCSREGVLHYLYSLSLLQVDYSIVSVVSFPSLSASYTFPGSYLSRFRFYIFSCARIHIRLKSNKHSYIEEAPVVYESWPLNWHAERKYLGILLPNASKAGP